MLDLIDTRQGTDSDPDFSRGNTLPLTTVPHGAVGWSPQSASGRWFFDRRAAKLQGFRATRQPSPWIGDYGEFLVTCAGGNAAPTQAGVVDSSYDAATTIARPDYFRTHLKRYDIGVEIAPTAHGGCFRFTCAHAGDLWIALQAGRGAVTRVPGAHGWIYGHSTSNQGGAPENFRAHFVAEIDAEVIDSGTFASNGATVPDFSGAGLWLRVRRPRNGAVTLRIATSLIDAEQARHNARAELSGRSFAQIRAAAARVWEEALGVIRLDGATLAQRQTFYRALYRCRLFPRRIDETDAKGRRRHYSPFDGRVHDGPMYTDFGFWDGYRALFPLLSLIAPDVLADMIAGWLNAYRAGGWLPNWVSPGYRGCMVGSHGTAVIADAWLKGIRAFDADTALEAMLKEATAESDTAQFGRIGGRDFATRGYVPADRAQHSVARTLDYSHGDYAIDRFARSLGRGELTRAIGARAANYRNVFDRRTLFFRGRLADGKWRAPFSAFEWSADYIEGSAWQYAWSVPHDAAGLIALHGGAKAFVRRLDRMLVLPPRFETGMYPHEIHEMTEMAAVPFGQYAHSNEPVHHVLYLFTCAGRPDRTQHWVRRVVDELYTPDHFPGDEDNGAMAAWYVCSTLGLFPLTCGHSGYVLGAPRFPRGTLRFEAGREWVIEARGGRGRELPPYVAGVAIDGRRHDGLEIMHAQIVGGGRLEFQLTSDAERAAERGRLRRPFSASQAGQSAR
ncbi:MAG: GH92 family glycosyl hydrolase [Nocardioides sp.]